TEVALTSNELFIKNKELQGLSLRNVALSVLNKKDKVLIKHQMDMVFTHFGVSGPAVLICSQFVVKELMKGSKHVKMVIDVLPEKTQESLRSLINKRMKETPKKTIKNIMKGIIPERLLDYLL